MKSPAFPLSVLIACLCLGCPSSGGDDDMDSQTETTSSGDGDPGDGEPGDGDPGDGDPGDGDPGDGDPGDGDGDPGLGDGECRNEADCDAQLEESCFAPDEPNCGPCMEGIDECMNEDECVNAGPSMVCGFADPGCYCAGTPRVCVEDCNVGGCDPHEVCGNDGLCTREVCTNDGDCTDMPGYCVEGRCFETLGSCEPIAA